MSGEDHSAPSASRLLALPLLDALTLWQLIRCSTSVSTHDVAEVLGLQQIGCRGATPPITSRQLIRVSPSRSQRRAFPPHIGRLKQAS